MVRVDAGDFSCAPIATTSRTSWRGRCVNSRPGSTVTRWSPACRRRCRQRGSRSARPGAAPVARQCGEITRRRLGDRDCGNARPDSGHFGAQHGPPIPEREQRQAVRAVLSGRAGASGPGTGMGLAIVQQIAEAHDGTVRVHSASGAGTEFAMSLPQEEDVRMSAGRILVVDDDPQIRRVLKVTAQRPGDSKSTTPRPGRKRSRVSGTRASTRAARHQHARHERARRVPGDSSHLRNRHHHAHRPRQRGRHGRGARRRSRRLRHQAVQAVRAVGTHSGGAPPHALGAGPRRPGLPWAGVTIDFDTREVACRPARAPDTERVRLAAVFRRPRQQSAVAPPVASGGLGPGLRRPGRLPARGREPIEKKIEPKPSTPVYLLTEPWVGYRLHLPPEQRRSRILTPSL